MIFGDCPYDECGELMNHSMPDASPMFQKSSCEKCNRVVWLLCSRIESIAYTEEGFAEEYDVNHETKHITKKVKA